MKEAAARIKINRLLEQAGWRFFGDAHGPANIQLEPSVTLQAHDLEDLGEDFEKAGKGFIDFLLLNEKGFPLVVLEAKAEGKGPLVGKEQARRYARSQNCRFVMLSNGNLHYFWDLERGHPHLITAFPTPASVAGYRKSAPQPRRLIEEPVGDDYVVLTQRPGYAVEAAWKNEGERAGFIETNGLRFLRPYQKKAITAVQQAVARGSDRFLLEMATGTGKTLTAAALIKLLLRTGTDPRCGEIPAAGQLGVGRRSSPITASSVTAVPEYQPAAPNPAARPQCPLRARPSPRSSASPAAGLHARGPARVGCGSPTNRDTMVPLNGWPGLPQSRIFAWCPREAGVNAGASPAGALRRFSTEDRANCVAARRGGEQAWNRTGRSQ